ncbi:MAG: hypothetical protein CL670_13970 [Balneola sp.]|nr:hypothetical protein [Balneola sp.]MBE80260.1 hypothetical protein [Balneola sp.]
MHLEDLYQFLDMKKTLKVFLIIVISILVLVGSAAVIAPIFLNEPLKKALTEEFRKQTNQDYILDYSTFDIGILGRSISVDSVVVKPDSASPHIRKISAQTISINGIQWFSLLNRSFPVFKSIVINKPNVEVFTRDYSSNAFSRSSNGEAEEIADKISTFNLIINSGSGKLVRQNGEELVTVADLSLRAQDVDVNQLLDGSELIFMDNLTINGSGIKWSLEKKLYQFTVGDFHFEKKAEYLSLDNVALTPVVQKYRFSEILDRQIDRIDLNIPALELIGFTLDSLASNQLEIDSMQITGAQMEVFRDKQKERLPGYNTKPLLHELATSTDFSFGLNTINISDTDITYQEHKPPSEEPGSISFNDINATVTNLRTESHPEFYNDSLRLNINARFMNTSPLTLDVGYATFDNLNSHTVHVQLDSFDPKDAANMLNNVAFVEIEDGFVESLSANMELNSSASSGEVTLLYKDLKVSFLNKDNPQKKGLKQWAGDFIANTFVLKSDNLGDKPRVGIFTFPRDKEKSIFAYWWKSLLEGIKQVIK